jgi:RND superfamily putative drug exporter
VLAAWAVAVVAVGIGAHAAGGRLRDTFAIPGTDSQRAVDLLERRFPAQNLPTAQVVYAARDGARVPEPLLARATGAIRKLPDVASVSSPRASENGDIALLTVTYSVESSDIPKDALRVLERATAPPAGVEVEYGGPVVDLLDSQSSVSDHSDEIGLVVALIIMVVSFGSFVAALLPLAIALCGVAAATSLLDLLASVFTVGTIGPVLGSMIGLGVGIDYSLFIVTRFRQNRADGMEIRPAIAGAIGTSGAAVLFAGITVCIALAGLTLAGIPYVSMLGLSAGLFVAVMVIAALTLLPALLGAVGKHVKPRDTSGSPFWRRWSHGVAKRPWLCLVGSLAVLLVLAAPVLRMELGFADDGDDPKSLTMRRAYDLVAQGFGPGANGPLLVTVALPAPTPSTERLELPALDELVARLRAEPEVAAATGPLPNRRLDAAVVVVQPTRAPNAEATQQLVRRLRDDVIPSATEGTVLAGHVNVGGETAELIDLTDRIDARLYVCIAFVVAGAFVLLMIVFRSIFVPLKAAVMNLLSIGAAYGVVVAVFQWGWGRRLIGLEDPVPIEAFVPLMMFAILFGLSMDYEVFLLSRIREEYARTADNRESVATGLTATARVITSAALIMISVFLSFVASDQPVVKMLGLGLAVAVAVDATLVRLVLVPATMELLGKANWWFPRFLDRIVPHLDVDAPGPRTDPLPPSPAAETQGAPTSVR